MAGAGFQLAAAAVTEVGQRLLAVGPVDGLAQLGALAEGVVLERADKALAVGGTGHLATPGVGRAADAVGRVGEAGNTAVQHGRIAVQPQAAEQGIAQAVGVLAGLGDLTKGIHGKFRHLPFDSAGTRHKHRGQAVF